MASDDVSRWPWDVLGLDGQPTGEDTQRIVRRAYAGRLKSIDPSDVEAFSALRYAYEAALSETQSLPPRKVAVTAPPLQITTEPHAPAADSEQPDPETLFEHLNSLLEKPQQSAQDWSEFFASPLLDDAYVRHDVEAQIVSYLAQPGRIASKDGLCLVTQADARFAWSIDGIGFLRRHPNQHEILRQITDAVQHSRPKNVSRNATKLPPLWARWWVLALAIPLPFVFLTILISRGLPWTPTEGQNGLEILMILQGGAFILTYIIIRVFGLFVYLITSMLHQIHWGQHIAILLKRRWIKTRLGQYSPFPLISSAFALIMALLFSLLVVEITLLDEKTVAAMRLQRLNADVIRQSYGLQSITPTTGIPNFFARLDGVAPPADDPLNIGSFKADKAAETHDPDAMIACGLNLTNKSPAYNEMTCKLGYSIKGNYLRVIGKRQEKLPEDHLMQQFSIGALILTFDKSGRILAEIDQGRRGIGFTQHAFMDSDKTPYLNLFSPSLLWSAHDAPLQATVLDDYRNESPKELSNIDLNGPMRLMIDWPDFPLPILNCKDPAYKGVGKDNCAFEQENISRSATWICKPDEYKTSCFDNGPIKQKRKTTAAPPEFSFDSETAGLMRELARRIALGGQHPPLPETPELAQLRDGMLRDMAVILRRPEAGEWALDPEAIAVAALRQPQFAISRDIYAHRQFADSEWDELQKTLTRIGIPPRDPAIDLFPPYVDDRG